MQKTKSTSKAAKAEAETRKVMLQSKAPPEAIRKQCFRLRNAETTRIYEKNIDKIAENL